MSPSLRLYTQNSGYVIDPDVRHIEKFTDVRGRFQSRHGTYAVLILTPDWRLVVWLEPEPTSDESRCFTTTPLTEASREVALAHAEMFDVAPQAAASSSPSEGEAL